MLESQTVKAKKGLQIIQSNSLIHRHPPWGAGMDQRPTIRTKLESDSRFLKCKTQMPPQQEEHTWSKAEIVRDLRETPLNPLASPPHLLTWSPGSLSCSSWYNGFHCQKAGKVQRPEVLCTSAHETGHSHSQIRYARNFKAREAFLALKASGSLQRIKGTGEVPGSLGTLTWWWNSTSSSSWTPQNSHGITTLSSTGGELLKPIKDSNWSLADCRISFWKITSGSSTPRGEVLPTLSGGKAHEGLQLVCLKKHRLKQNKKKERKKKQRS